MQYIIITIFCLNLLGCGGVVQPHNHQVSPLQSPDKVVVIVTAKPSPSEGVIEVVTVESTVVHLKTKGQTVRVSPQTPTPPPTPVWIDDKLVVVDPAWPKVIELQVGQQLAVMPLRYKRYGWEVKYNTQVLEQVEKIPDSKVPTVAWLWRAIGEGEVTIEFASIVPTLAPCETIICPLGDVITTKNLKVKVIP